MTQIPIETIPTIVEAISREAGDRLKELLESRHIYQRVIIDALGLVESLLKDTPGRKDFAAAIVDTLRDDPFSPALSQMYTARYGSDEQCPTPVLLLKNIKLFCGKCDSLETYAPVWFRDLVNDMLLPNSRQPSFDPPLSNQHRLYALVYQCQNCKSTPEAFLVRRREWQLHLDGRSPMEQVSVPAFVPKAERWLYRDALIATHGGKTLAGLFYLRAFIEAFARRVAKSSERLTGDELMELYSQKLPGKQRDLMPSLRHWYSEISGALHAAREDGELFERAREAIDQHLEIRRVFKISDE